jgi:hypothetical protein
MTFTFQVASLCARQRRARRAMRRCFPGRARPSQRQGLFALSKGAQAPLEPQRSSLPGTPITALAGASNYRFWGES